MPRVVTATLVFLGLILTVCALPIKFRNEGSNNLLTPEGLVTISSGKIQGLVLPEAREFFAIPYAAPPVGPLRFQPPQAPKPWAPATLNATAYGYGCPQVHYILLPRSLFDPFIFSHN